MTPFGEKCCVSVFEIITLFCFTYLFFIHIYRKEVEIGRLIKNIEQCITRVLQTFQFRE